MALDGHFDIIAHGCNCHNTMERGISLAIKRVFPEAWRADQSTLKGDRQKMGLFSHSWAKVKGGKKLLVVNLYTQFLPGDEEIVGESVEERQSSVAASSMALADLLKKNAGRAPWAPRKPVLGIPRIGASGGLCWEANRALIVSALGGVARVAEVHFPQGSD